MPEHLLQGRLEALARGVEDITIAVLVTTLPRLKRGEPWYELAVDDDHRRLARYPQVFSRWPGRLPEGDGPVHDVRGHSCSRLLAWKLGAGAAWPSSSPRVASRPWPSTWKGTG
ncbi:hypothetical protein [Streptomyces rimosus]|uniref:hypothetical protein n=1 Tax=Streptomyces rimosus TaxID=1927 RepID=UPI0037B81710